MREDAAARFRCPKTGLPLTLEATSRDGDDVREGALVSADGTRWPVRDSIPRFVPEDNYADSFGFQWNRFPGTQLDSVSGLAVSRDRFLAQWALPPEWFAGKRILDVGCGAGRFAEVALSLGATVTAVDLSNAVDACWRNLKRNPRLTPAQASIYELPFTKGSFDAVYCFGVLQHTPDVRRSFFALVDMVRPGGELAVDVYKAGWSAWTYPKQWLRPLTTRVPQRALRLHRAGRSAPSRSESRRGKGARGREVSAAARARGRLRGVAALERAAAPRVGGARHVRLALAAL
jgi:2-polyprenyl-3-methyl-5-hydroxy-6-metoxy-1,4-benzoquinol methylase